MHKMCLKHHQIILFHNSNRISFCMVPKLGQQTPKRAQCSSTGPQQTCKILLEQHIICKTQTRGLIQEVDIWREAQAQTFGNPYDFIVQQSCKFMGGRVSKRGYIVTVLVCGGLWLKLPWSVVLSRVSNPTVNQQHCLCSVTYLMVVSLSMAAVSPFSPV